MKGFWGDFSICVDDGASRAPQASILALLEIEGVSSFISQIHLDASLIASSSWRPLLSLYFLCLAGLWKAGHQWVTK
jgi:hypothetical protein